MASKKISTTGAASRRHPPDRGPAPDEMRLIALAKRVTDASSAPIVGGVAVILHGGGRATYDIDVYSENFWKTHEALESAGIMWDAARREHLVDGVAVHMVDEHSLGGPPKRVSTIRGVRVIGLADLVRAKLTVGLEEIRRHKDIAHVVDLITRVPLKKDFAAKLPKHLRSAFKELVEQVHGRRGSPVPPRVTPMDYFGRHGTSRRRAAS
jgi:hypothetical protein